MKHFLVKVLSLVLIFQTMTPFQVLAEDITPDEAETTAEMTDNTAEMTDETDSTDEANDDNSTESEGDSYAERDDNTLSEIPDDEKMPAEETEEKPADSDEESESSDLTENTEETEDRDSETSDLTEETNAAELTEKSEEADDESSETILKENEPDETSDQISEDSEEMEEEVLEPVSASGTISEYQENAIIDGSLQLTYSLFGAVGDGKTNDYEAVKAAHDYANSLYISSGKMITVYGEPDRTYYISAAEKTINITTDVDWQGCTFIFDDYADSDRNGQNDIAVQNPVFDITSDMTAESGWSLSLDITPDSALRSSLNLSPSSTNVKGIINAVKNNTAYNKYPYVKKDYDKCSVWGAYIEDTSSRWIRKGVNSSTSKTGEIITFNSTSGQLLTKVSFDYPNLNLIRVFPIRNTGISVGNANIISLTNNVVYPDSKRSGFTYRNIRVRYTGNVTLHNINHELNESAHPFSSSYQNSPQANLYYGIIDLLNDAYVKIDSVNLSAHTPALKYGTADTYDGTYDMCMDNVAYLDIDNLGYSNYSRDMLDESKWGVIGTNQCKNVFIENSNINRVDSHRGFTDLYIKNSIFGVKGLTLIGQGKMYAENVVFDQAYQPLHLRQDYGAAWDGDMYLKNASFLLKDNIATYLVYANNTENWNFGYRSYFPNLYMDTVYVGAKNKAETVLLQFCDTIQKTRNASDPNNLYYFKGNIQLKNLSVNNITPFRLFPFEFPKNDFNLTLGSYGGNNKVILDLDKKITINGTLNVSSPKFQTGTVTGDFNGTRSYFENLYNAGMGVLNGTYSTIPAYSISTDSSNFTMKINERRVLKVSLSPANATRHINYSSSNSGVARVEETGLITAVSAGTAVITIQSGTASTQCYVTVDGSDSGSDTSGNKISLDKSSAEMKQGESIKLTATVTPAGSTVTWKSSNTSVATVSNGTVKAVSAGKTVITATAAGKTASCEVIVNSNSIAVTSVKLSKTAITMTEGDNQTITATVSPSNASNQVVRWASDNNGVATVNNGVITALKEGKAVITVTTASGGKTAQCSVTVNKKIIPLTGISFREKEVKVTLNNKQTLMLAFEPADTTDKAVTYSSDRPDIVTVDENGMVTGKAIGTAVITAKNSDGKLTDTCSIEVTEELNGLIQDADGVWRLYKDGEIRTAYTGLYPYGTSLFYINAGVMDKTHEGIEYYQKEPYYVVKGQVTYTYTGLGEYKGSLHYFTNSVKDESFNGIAYYKGEPYFVVNGKVTYNYVGLGEYKGALHYFTSSKKDTSYTGLSYYQGQPYYVLNGVVSYKYNGLGQYKEDWWYVVNSMVDKSYTGNYTWKGTKYYIFRGKVS